MTIAGIPYLVIVMSTVHIYSVNFLYMESLKSVKIASLVPKDSNEKRPACLGQLEGKLKNLVVVFLYSTILITCTFANKAARQRAKLNLEKPVMTPVF